MMLSRGLPWSVLVHTVALVLVAFFGNRVATAPMQPPRSINVRMVQLPRTEPPAARQPVEQPAVQQPQPEIRQELPPKELPKPKPEQKPVEKKPQPEIKVEQTEPEPAAETKPVTEAPVATLSAPNIAGTDEPFPFAWYISLIEGQIVDTAVTGSVEDAARDEGAAQ